MTPIRVQLSRARGWRMPPNTVKVDRTTRWGNPFVVGVDGDAQQCVAMFGAMLRGEIATHRPELRETQRRYQSLLMHELHELRGRNLACWCAIGAPCHADLLLEMANAPKS